MLDTIPELLPDLAELYEDLHAHPELSFQEVRTAGLLADRLEALGYEVTRGVGGTGVVAVLASGSGPTVLLRADIDALPVEELTGLPYASTARATGQDGREVPVAHACGHDMHAAWMIGVATVLVRHRDAWSGRVMIVLQPAEELGMGAAAMVDDGLYERFGTPDVALGQHVAPAPAGWVLHRSGPVMAGSDALKVTLHGRGGHGAAPHTTIDPIVMAASTVMKLQTVVSRTVEPTDVAVVTVGSLHAGTKENIIPDRAELHLSVRSFEEGVREKVHAAIERIVHGEAQAAGATKDPEVDLLYGFPPLRNDPATTATVAAAFLEHFGPERVVEGPLVPASEDFGQFATRGGFPSAFWFVGGADADLWTKALAAGTLSEDVPSNHSPYYAPIQQPTLSTGIEAMVTAAMCWLRPA
ncbi:MAG TPA: amidohydrolase [Acidimicrobiales bacterium]|nr:amidohydrolase [Acidimicrobiales bacterium]